MTMINTKSTRIEQIVCAHAQARSSSIALVDALANARSLIQSKEQSCALPNSTQAACLSGASARRSLLPFAAIPGRGCELSHALLYTQNASSPLALLGFAVDGAGVTGVRSTPWTFSGFDGVRPEKSVEMLVPFGVDGAGVTTPPFGFDGAGVTTAGPEPG